MQILLQERCSSICLLRRRAFVFELVGIFIGVESCVGEAHINPEVRVLLSLLPLVMDEAIQSTVVDDVRGVKQLPLPM